MKPADATDFPPQADQPGLENLLRATSCGFDSRLGHHSQTMTDLDAAITQVRPEPAAYILAGNSEPLYLYKGSCRNLQDFCA